MVSDASFAVVVAASDSLRTTRSRKKKVGMLVEALTAIEQDEQAIAVAYLAGEPRQDRLGVGWATLAAVDVAPAPAAGLTLTEVDGTLDAIAATTGPGSVERRRRLLDTLFAAATEGEQEFLRRLVLRELRQGSTAGLMTEAVAVASGAPLELVRRAAMISGDLVETGVTALTRGAPALADIRLEVMRGLQPMLASTADSVAAAFATDRDGEPERSVEVKLDGARIQVHRRHDEVRIYTRNLNDATGRLPEVVEQVRRLPLTAVILDGEAITFDQVGRPRPFQATMSRFGTGGDDIGRQRPLTPRFFDIIHLDGVDLLDQPLRARLDALDTLPAELLVDRLITADPAAATAFTEQALAAGHEGVMVKRLEALYEAGTRGGAWLKVKPVHTLDLVVLAVEWGSGRREGWLSNLHLGARDPGGGFVMLGKTFKGLTDAMLTWQTEHLLALETSRRRHVVEVRPELVVEVAFDGVQASPRYPGGVALRFARVKGYRPDKSAADADTIDTVVAMLGR